MPARPTLGQIVAYLKYQSTRRVNELRDTPGARLWQRNYYEHIIRDAGALARIRAYIANNPQQWELDQLRPRQ
jgi:putative transposase